MNIDKLFESKDVPLNLSCLLISSHPGLKTWLYLASLTGLAATYQPILISKHGRKICYVCTLCTLSETLITFNFVSILFQGSLLVLLHVSNTILCSSSAFSFVFQNTYHCFITFRLILIGKIQ